jgi:hypothetical protein
VFLLLLAAPATAEAYVGPGAGIAFVGSFLVILTTIFLSFLSLLAWPFRMVYRAIKFRGMPKPRIKRFIVVGLDGQDPVLTDRFLKAGKLPNFARLAEQGCYERLRTTFPSVSPVAWSSFSTGSHPARHNIYDFLDRDRRTYLPVLSSTRIGSVSRRLKIGKYQIPLGRPELRLLRKSKPFWKVLGEHNIWSTVLRVPITFPPEKFKGALLSAMCVPDLLGTQGTFTYFTTRPGGGDIKEGGIRVHLAGASAPPERAPTATRPSSRGRRTTSSPAIRPSRSACAPTSTGPRGWRASRSTARPTRWRRAGSAAGSRSPSRRRPGSSCAASAGCWSPRWASTSAST